MECGSRGDCDEFCGDTHSEMRDNILFLREENEKLRECVERIANKKWFGEVQNDARKTLEAINTK